MTADKFRNAQRVFGERIRALRTRRGWSLTTLAARAGMHRSFVGQVERGEKGITLFAALRLCDALAVDAGEVFKGIVPPQEIERWGRSK